MTQVIKIKPQYGCPDRGLFYDSFAVFDTHSSSEACIGQQKVNRLLDSGWVQYGYLPPLILDGIPHKRLMVYNMGVTPQKSLFIPDWVEAVFIATHTESGMPVDFVALLSENEYSDPLFCLVRQLHLIVAKMQQYVELKDSIQAMIRLGACFSDLWEVALDYVEQR